ncbi:peptidase [Haematobacter missouriensis]|uniref:L,D-transpeptidase n=1 Tax=Haematobacter missouriensis TaxID=366616 RepID=A0A212AMY2_9RHOB|nr:L,D-transpeptidase [Haematobacter missouriensis]KFI25362.1 peptidase [Haematobacter missouriensis]OWJ70677.1 L,D-transpeptidase [Haematobacter missouriensis]OWJ82847.1 L,D-transpeptidase [Haematobacter missouriensis]
MTTPATRRGLLFGVLAMPFLAPALARAQEPNVRAPSHRRNISSFVTHRWQDHFATLGKGVIVADLNSRAVHFWSGDGLEYRIYPSSVPMSDELTRTGFTEVVRKRIGPDWTPTANMIARDPSLHYMPPGPDNPLGTHALYLTWPAYLIHGTQDTRKIGRPSSSGCVGLYNEHIEELYGLAPIGTQVRLL